MDSLVQWEYRLESFGGAFKSIKVVDLESILNGWGEEGWEIISFAYSPDNTGYKVLAKRPLTFRAKRERSREQF
jgi:hypothetical protein